MFVPLSLRGHSRKWDDRRYRACILQPAEETMPGFLHGLFEYVSRICRRMWYFASLARVSSTQWSVRDGRDRMCRFRH